MLAQETLVAFLKTADAGRAKAFYEGALGLTLIGDHEHLIVFKSGPSRVALQKADGPVTPPVGTAMGWNVMDLRGQMTSLIERGVAFERFDGMEQDDLGVWSPGGSTTGVAWFKDPDGNLLSLSQG
jgi:catechol 2,3-dioxygenase-like lactoylglutathione lyase family enzyme